MGALSKYLRNVAGGGLTFWCEGCKCAHAVWVGDGPGPRWSWNGDAERPVFGPSVLVTWSEPANLHNHEAMQRDLADVKRRRDAGEQGAKVPLANKVCHTFIGCNGAKPGEIIFLGDCTHELAGQVRPLAEMPGMRSIEA